MKIKYTLMIGLFAASVSLFGREPFILKTTGSNIFKEQPSAISMIRKPLSAPLQAQGSVLSKPARRANADGETNIAIKLNLTQIALKNLSFQAEYGFHKKMSAALGFSFLMKRSLGVLYSSPDQYGDNFTVPDLSGFAITPEFRFYPGGSDDRPAPNGFYIAAYFRYAKYKLTQTVSYTEDKTPSNPNPKTYSGTAEQTYGGINGGIMIGRQWIIGDHFTIDWWIVGGGYGKAKYTYGWTAPGANLNASQQADVKEQAEANFDGFSLFGMSSSVSTTPNSAKMTVSGVPMFSFRFMGLCLGYAF